MFGVGTGDPAPMGSLIEQPASLGTIRDAIVDKYDVVAATCERDVMTFLLLQAVGLVEINDGSPV